MHRFGHPTRALFFVIIIALLPVVTQAQTDSTPEGTPEGVQEPIWLRVDGIQEAVVRTWGEFPEPGTTVPEESEALLVNGLVVQFDTEENAAGAVEAFRDWMVASMQVNIVDTDLALTDEDVSDLGDNAMAVTASGTTGDTPLTISVVVVQQENRLLAVGSSVRADQDVLPQVTGIISAMLEREPDGDESQDGVGRFTGGLWEIFPDQDDESLDGMTRQGDLPIYTMPDSTPEA